MRTPPLEVVASWPTPNFDNPERRGPANQIISSTLLVLATAFVALRIVTRKFITHSFGWDDVLIIIAYLPAAAFIVAGIVAEENFGWGLHVWDVRPEKFEWGLKLALSSHILFDLATTFTKLSMLALIINLITASNKVLRLIIYALMAFISINCVVFLIKSLLQCRPLHLYWTISFEEDNCIDEAVHLLVAGIINTITDFVVVFLPLIIVRRLYKEHKLTSRQSIIVSLLFALGFLASAAGAARTYLTWIMLTHPDHDTTWRAWAAWMASSIELFLGLIAATVPATKPFFIRYVPRLMGPAASRISFRSRASSARRSQKDAVRAVSTAASMDMSPTVDIEKGPSGLQATSPIIPYTDPESVAEPVSTPDLLSYYQRQTYHSPIQQVSRFSTSTMGSPMFVTDPQATRDSLSTVREGEEISRFSTSTIDSARSSTPLMAEPKKAHLPDLNKPLPRIKTQTSLYTISIVLDYYDEGRPPGIPGEGHMERGPVEGRDVAARDLTSRNASSGTTGTT